MIQPTKAFEGALLSFLERLRDRKGGFLRSVSTSPEGLCYLSSCRSDTAARSEQKPCVRCVDEPSGSDFSQSRGSAGHHDGVHDRECPDETNGR